MQSNAAVRSLQRLEDFRSFHSDILHTRFSYSSNRYVHLRFTERNLLLLMRLIYDRANVGLRVFCIFTIETTAKNLQQKYLFDRIYSTYLSSTGTSDWWQKIDTMNAVSIPIDPRASIEPVMAWLGNCSLIWRRSFHRSETDGKWRSVTFFVFTISQP